MQPTLINPYDFQKRIDQYASNIRLLWNPTIERFQVFETIAPVVELVADTTQLELRRSKLRPLFTIMNPDHSYRDPDESDLDKIRNSVEMTIDLNVKGFDHFADEMERADNARTDSVAPGVKDAMKWGAEEMYKARVQKGILGFK